MKNKIVWSLLTLPRRFRARHTYKDRLFRTIFRDKKELLSLYNAINGTHYTNPDHLEVRPLEDAVYLGYKNDLSFLISNTLNLYEHQSTNNPNMPLRGLIYFTDMLKAYVEEKGYNIYSSKLIPLPVPLYIVFYNGTDEKPDKTEWKLSDAFADSMRDEAALECKAVVLNINEGHNQALMEKCKSLEGYSYFVACVRRNLEWGVELDEAIDHAIDECIENDKIADILVKNRAEVKNMLLTDFDEKKYRKMLIRDSRAEGLAIGRSEGKSEATATLNELNKRLFEDGRLDDLNRSWNDPDFQEQLLKEYKLHR